MCHDRNDCNMSCEARSKRHRAQPDQIQGKTNHKCTYITLLFLLALPPPPLLLPSVNRECIYLYVRNFFVSLISHCSAMAIGISMHCVRSLSARCARSLVECAIPSSKLMVRCIHYCFVHGQVFAAQRKREREN